MVSYIGGGILVLVIGYFAYVQFFWKPANEKSKDAYWVGLNYAAADSTDAAIEELKPIVKKYDGKIGGENAQFILARQYMVKGLFKKAITELSVLQRFRNFTLIKVKILTGRTHQIRVHLNSIGYPVVGDELYKNRKLKKTDLGRLFLHASALSFIDLDGTKKTYVSDLPKQLNDFLNKESTKRKNSLKLKSKKI